MNNRRLRLERERATLEAMIALFCRDQHAPATSLCPDCAALQEYAFARLEYCAFGEEKPKCSECPIHCYKPSMREAIRKVMRYSGPRMIVKHPVMALRHVVGGLGTPPRNTVRRAS